MRRGPAGAAAGADPTAGAFATGAAAGAAGREPAGAAAVAGVGAAAAGPDGAVVDDGATATGGWTAAGLGGGARRPSRYPAAAAPIARTRAARRTTGVTAFRGPVDWGSKSMRAMGGEKIHPLAPARLVPDGTIGPRDRSPGLIHQPSTWSLQGFGPAGRSPGSRRRGRGLRGSGTAPEPENHRQFPGSQHPLRRSFLGRNRKCTVTRVSGAAAQTALRVLTLSRHALPPAAPFGLREQDENRHITPGSI